MPLKKLRDFLDSHDIRYVVISHSPTYTAQETAQAAHVHGREFAKTTMVKLDGKMAMVVLPATDKVDLKLLAAAADADHAELASEEDFQGLFPQCDVGAMPPFGNLYDMDVYVDEGMTSNKNIAFNAGSHTELVQMGFKDVTDLVKLGGVRVSKDYV